MEKIIDLRNITVSYGDNVILDKLNLYINEKEFITAAAKPQRCAVLPALCSRTVGKWSLKAKSSMMCPRTNAG